MFRIQSSKQDIQWDKDTDFSKKYYLNYDESNNTDTEKMIFNLIHRNYNKTTIETLFYKNVVEIYITDTFPKLWTEEQQPLFSMAIFLEDNPNINAIFTDLDSDNYKIKNIEQLNNCLICGIEKNKLVTFDTKFYAGLFLNEETDTETQKTPILFIHLWDKEKFSFENKELMPQDLCIFQNNISLNKTNTSELNKIYLDDNEIESIIYQKKGKILTCDTLFSVKLNQDKINSIITNYGEEFLPFLDNTYKLEETNVVYNNKIYKNTFSKDVCYWLINEYETHTLQVVESPPYKNYQNYLNLQMVPSAISYIKFMYYHIFDKIRMDYGIYEKNINYKLQDVFICKYKGVERLEQNFSLICKKNIHKDLNEDGTFLTINIQLNEYVDFIGNDIIFERMIPEDIIDNEGNFEVNPDYFNVDYILQQGDMIVYNGRAKRTNGNIVAGVKYVLVYMIKINI